MKKEVIIAIVFGVGLGLTVAFFMVRQIRTMEMGSGSQIKTNTGKVKLSNILQSAQNLEIVSPASDAVVDQSTIQIKGKGEPGSLMVIQSVAKEIVEKQKKSEFSVTFPLVAGENTISITMYPQDKTVRTQTKVIRVFNLSK